MNAHHSDSALEEARRISASHVHLLRIERSCLGDLLRSFAEFDDRGLHRALGHATFFDYLHRGLGLSKGVAHSRMVGARLLRRFPEVEEPVRDGRLCLTTIVEVARVLTEENRATVLPRFFGLSRQEAMELAAEINPAVRVPRRALVTSSGGTPGAAGGMAAGPAGEMAAGPAGEMAPGPAPAPGQPHLRGLRPVDGPQLPDEGSRSLAARASPHSVELAAPQDAERSPDATGSTVELDSTHPERGVQPLRITHDAVPRTTIDPLTAVDRRLHVTVSREFVAMLRKARDGESHRNPDATIADVLMEGLKLLIEKQQQRKARVPRTVKRAVMKRDGGRCQWKLADGSLCGSTAHLEVDHIVPRARGGPSTVDNCRVLCRAHNLEAARRIYGDEHMDRFAPIPTPSPTRGEPGRSPPPTAAHGPPCP